MRSAHGRALPRSSSGSIPAPFERVPPSACNPQSAACWRMPSSSAPPPLPSSVPPLPLCELFLPARVRRQSAVGGWTPSGWMDTQGSPSPPQGALPEDTHGHAGLALLLPLAADPLLLCPLCSPLLLHRGGTLACTPQAICILSLPRDRSLTPRTLTAPREPEDSDPGEWCICIRRCSTTAATPGASQ